LIRKKTKKDEIVKQNQFLKIISNKKITLIKFKR
jgi:hypothetical protein